MIDGIGETEPGTPAYTSLTDIATEWKLTNRSLGDLLRNGGYRDDGKPTTKALDEGLAIVRFNGDYPSYSWSRELVGAFLEKSGRKKRQLSDDAPKKLLLVKMLIV